MKMIILFVVVLLYSSCTILDKKIALYSGDGEVAKSKNLKMKKIGERVEKEHCNKAYFLISTANKNQFDVLDDLIAEHKEYNSLVDAHVETDMFVLAPIYMSVCHKVKGRLVQF